MDQDTVASISQAGEKPTNEELSARIDEIADLLGKGFTRKEIRRYVQVKTAWGISDDTLDRYLKRAAALLGRAARKKADYILAIAKYRLDELYARTMVDKNYTEAREAVLALCRLYGLPIDGPTRRAGPDDDPDQPIAILVAPERLGHEEWQAKVLEEQRFKQLPQAQEE